MMLILMMASHKDHWLQNGHLWSEQRNGQIDTAVAESPTSRTEEQGVTLTPSHSPTPGPQMITYKHTQGQMSKLRPQERGVLIRKVLNSLKLHAVLSLSFKKVLYINN